MNSLKWIKVSTSLFENSKLLLLEQQEDGCLLQLLWVKLLCLAGKHCPEGTLLLTVDKPYTPAMLATVLRLDKALVARGLELFCTFGMLQYRDGAYSITNWNRYQSAAAYENKLRYDREYRARKREAKKEKPGSFLDLVKEA